MCPAHLSIYIFSKRLRHRWHLSLSSQQAGKVTVFDNSGPVGIMTTPRMPNTHAMLNQARNFIRAVQGVKPAPCASEEAVKDLEIAMDYIRMFKS